LYPFVLLNEKHPMLSRYVNIIFQAHEKH